jgi:hypothetical protein
MKAMKALTSSEAIAIPAGVQELDGQSNLVTTGGDFEDTGLGLAAGLGVAAGLLIATPLGLAAGGLAAASALILWACL